MTYYYLFALLFIQSCTLFEVAVNALPMTRQDTKLLQVTFYQEKLKTFDFSNDENLKNWYQSEEYGIYSTMVDYYENLVDLTLSSESEELLIDLIHLPRTSMNHILNLQANLIGMEKLTGKMHIKRSQRENTHIMCSMLDKQLLQMPSIIGKHIQQMNTKLFKSVEEVITIHWSTFWDIRILEENQEDLMLSFLTSFNGIVAKKLMDGMDNYDLLEKIKDDIMSITTAEESDLPATSVLPSWLQTLKHDIRSVLLWLWEDNGCTGKTSNKNTASSDMEIDFLRQHLANIRASLLMELHTQFMDFYSRLQADILDQLSTYYDQ